MAAEAEHRHLLRCIELARQALEAGDEPFGSVLVGADGSVLAEDRNRTRSGDATRHPEFELAREIVSDIAVEGPVPELEQPIRELHRRFRSRNESD